MRFVSGYDFSHAENLESEGGGGFNPRVKPIEPALALAAEGRFFAISAEFPDPYPACKVAKPFTPE